MRQHGFHRLLHLDSGVSEALDKTDVCNRGDPVISIFDKIPGDFGTQMQNQEGTKKISKLKSSGKCNMCRW